MTGLLSAAFLCFSGNDQGPLPIMEKMAAKIEASVDARRQYVYKQRISAKLVRANGQIARAEKREYTAAPGPERTEKTLVSLQGEYHKSKKEIIRYDQPGFEKGGMDIDGGLMKDLIKDLANSEKSRDGIPHSVFPFRANDLQFFKFTYAGQTEVKGRKAHRIAFEPVNKKSNCLNIGDEDYDDEDCVGSRPWKGEVVVDAEEFQPVRIFTDLTFKMPWGVKVFLGTNIRQTGFSASYTRVAPDVWFPATYGTEFRLDVLFGYKRVITLALDSSDFQRAEAKSEITFAPVDK
jgi:hypothetical protein